MSRACSMFALWYSSAPCLSVSLSVPLSAWTPLYFHLPLPSPPPRVTKCCSRPQGRTKQEKTFCLPLQPLLKNHQDGWPKIKFNHQPMPSDHVPKCHISMVLNTSSDGESTSCQTLFCLLVVAQHFCIRESEYLELERTHKDCWVGLLAPVHDHPKIRP